MPTIFCIGRNYAAHAREMGAAPQALGACVVFLKPWQALVAPGSLVRLPAGAHEIHHEAELVVRVGGNATADAAGLGLDLTDRPLQAEAKAKGLPWARAKGFRASAPLGPLVPVAALPPLDTLRFSLRVNGTERQRGDAALMLRPVTSLLAELDAWFGLAPGDLVFTGTPEGVGPLRPGDQVALAMDDVPAAAAHFSIA